MTLNPFRRASCPSTTAAPRESAKQPVAARSGFGASSASMPAPMGTKAFSPRCVITGAPISIKPMNTASRRSPRSERGRRRPITSHAT